MSEKPALVCPKHGVPLQPESVSRRDTEYGYYFHCPEPGCGWTYFVLRTSKKDEGLKQA